MEFLILVVLIVLNGLLAMSEIALVSSRRSRLEHAAERGNRGARAALRLLESPTRFLSTVQIGITLVGIVAGAFGEATISDDLAAWLSRVPAIAPYSRLVATIVVVLLITYLSLVIGELVPKRLAMNNPERVASMLAPPMRVLSRITAPIVHALSASTDLLLRLFGSKPSQEQIVTEEDVRSMIRQGTAAGVFHEKERELVERVFRLGDLRVSALMVPRADIVCLEADAPTERVRVAVAASSHSHFPVCRGGLDNLIGVVHVKDLIQAGLLTNRIDLKTLARKPLFVPESTPALRMIEEFRRAQQHIAFILDEYGVVTGLITLNDIVESILGQFVRYGEEAEPLAVQRADGSWLLDGGLSVQDLKGLMDVDTLPEEERTTFETLGGFVMAYLGHVPRTGETFEYDRFRFEVIDMDRHRVDKVLLTFTRPKLLDDEGAGE